jgi:hypothetical protein
MLSHGRRGFNAGTINPLRLAAFVVACLLCSSPLAHGQEPAAARPATIRVFIDCTNTPCDENYFRTEMTFVEHVRDRQNADVHILLTSQPTGGGGREITFDFFGQGRFMGRDDRLTERFLVAVSQDEIRSGMVRVMSLGLVSYLLETEAISRLRVTTVPVDPAKTAAALVDDPWNRWSLRANLNGNSSGERRSKSFYVNTNFNANRTTDETKLNLNARFNYRESKFELEEGRLYVAPNRDYGVNGLYVKSLDGHWSAGVRGNWTSSTYNNEDWAWSAAPAIEWDLFPYSESTRRLMTFNYSVGPRGWNYQEPTIFGKLEETRVAQAFEMMLSMRQRWGTVGTSVEIASFIPDVEQNHVSMYGDISLNLVRGLSLNLGANFDSIRDQIGLRAEEATSEEVLVNQRQLATSYRYYVFFGVSYTFGSIFSPIVNPRFGN